jgi:transcription initiation factor TFIID subunit TAF12
LPHLERQQRQQQAEQQQQQQQQRQQRQLQQQQRVAADPEARLPSAGWVGVQSKL